MRIYDAYLYGGILRPRLQPNQQCIQPSCKGYGQRGVGVLHFQDFRLHGYNLHRVARKVEAVEFSACVSPYVYIFGEIFFEFLAIVADVMAHLPVALSLLILSLAPVLLVERECRLRRRHILHRRAQLVHTSHDVLLLSCAVSELLSLTCFACAFSCCARKEM